jgi:MFS transporter, OFA family, oxalate/formate antiporter
LKLKQAAVTAQEQSENNDMKNDKKFYGWVVITMLFISYSATTVSTNTLPFFFPELIKEFGWTNAQVVQPAANYFIYIAVFSPIVGLLLVKRSPRFVMTIGMIVSLFCALAFAYMQSYTQFHLIYLVFSLGITCCGLLPSMVIISRWFKKKRGLATGIFLVGSSAGNMIFPQIASRLVPTQGWRFAAICIAILAAIMSFIPLYFIKNTPEEIGQNPDGVSDSEQQAITQAIVAEHTITVNELLKKPIFHVLLLITAAFWFCGFGVLQNLRLYLTDYGFTIQKAANISFLFSMFSIIGKLSFGYFSDKFDKMNILIIATLGLIGGVLSLKLVSINPDFAYLYTIFYGVGYSGAFAMIQLTVADMYKGESFKKVLSIVNSFDSIGGFAGVALMGYLRTQDGNYGGAMTMLLSICTASFVLALILKKMRSTQTL